MNPIRRRILFSLALLSFTALLFAWTTFSWFTALMEDDFTGRVGFVDVDLEVYFDDGNGGQIPADEVEIAPGVETCTLASNSAQFANELVIITVKNYDTNGDANTINVINPADYPTFSVINGLNNQMTQFYYTYSGQYRYSFGRNISGFYVFNLELPLDRYLNPRYAYTIEHQFYLLNNASNYIPGLPGKYFYIEAGTRNRTRRFNIFIRELAAPITTAPWGLFDFFRTWGEED